LEGSFAPLDVVGSETPPAGVFDDAMMQIDADGSELPGTITNRAARAGCQELSPGVTFRILHDDHDLKRRSMLIRMAPGAVYQAHPHDAGDEECLVIEGDLSFGDLTLTGGDFHLAKRGMVHPPSRSLTGCLLHVTTGLH
jgi:anti-sigma factor ChrR (cupin superfamily)